MNRSPKVTFILTLALALCLAAPACKTKSALDQALEQRARWTVLALDWTQNEDQVVLLSTRVNGPANSPLDRLTVRIVLQDASGASIEGIWHTYDLSELPLGGPEDITIRIPAGVPVDGLGLDRVLRPTADERARIEELAGL
jgi:hypothetical protein